LNALVEESLNFIADYATQTFEYDLQEDAAISLVVQ
jgi:hypothetical protein